jgi:glycosyltransferase involved in cell wall biosynthesis
MAMKKILRVISSMNPALGGVATAVDYSAKSLKMANVGCIDVLTLDNSQDEWIKNQSKYYTIHAVGQRFGKYGISIKFITWLYANVNKYDFVIIDGLWRFTMIAGYVSWLKKVPFCVMPHGMLDPYFKKSTLKYICKLPAWFLIDGPVISLSKYLLFTCTEEKELGLKSYPFYKSEPFIARLGFDFDRYDGYKSSTSKTFENNHEISKDSKVLLFLGRIDPKKGVEILIEAFSSVAKKHDKLLLVLVGPVLKVYKRKLEILLENEKISDRVVFVGMLSGEDKWSAYKAADFFVLPSHQENYGITIVESLSIGLPVLVSNKVNIYKEIEGEKAGLICFDDIKSIESSLLEIERMSAEEREVLSNNALICFEKYFSDKSFVDGIRRLIDSI